MANGYPGIYIKQSFTSFGNYANFKSIKICKKKISFRGKILT